MRDSKVSGRSGNKETGGIVKAVVVGVIDILALTVVRMERVRQD